MSSDEARKILSFFDSNPSKKNVLLSYLSSEEIKSANSNDNLANFNTTNTNTTTNIAFTTNNPSARPDIQLFVPPISTPARPALGPGTPVFSSRNSKTSSDGSQGTPGRSKRPRADSGNTGMDQVSTSNRRSVVVGHNLSGQSRKDIVAEIIKNKPADAVIEEIKFSRDNQVIIIPSSEKGQNSLLKKENWKVSSSVFTPRLNISANSGCLMYVKNVDIEENVGDFELELNNRGISFSNLERVLVGPERKKTYTLRLMVHSKGDRDKLTSRGLVVNYLHHKVECHVKNTVLMCFKCQGYGHTSRDCENPEKCLLCGEGHNLKACPSSGPDLIKKCVNCAEPHLANSRDCRVRIEHVRTERKKANSIKPASSNPRVGTPKPISSNSFAPPAVAQQSFASVTAGRNLQGNSQNSNSNPRVANNQFATEITTDILDVVMDALDEILSISRDDICNAIIRSVSNKRRRSIDAAAVARSALTGGNLPLNPAPAPTGKPQGAFPKTSTSSVPANSTAGMALNSVTAPSLTAGSTISSGPPPAKIPPQAANRSLPKPPIFPKPPLLIPSATASVSQPTISSTQISLHTFPTTSTNSQPIPSSNKTSLHPPLTTASVGLPTLSSTQSSARATEIQLESSIVNNNLLTNITPLPSLQLSTSESIQTSYTTSSAIQHSLHLDATNSITLSPTIAGGLRPITPSRNGWYREITGMDTDQEAMSLTSLTPVDPYSLTAAAPPAIGQPHLPPTSLTGMTAEEAQRANTGQLMRRAAMEATSEAMMNRKQRGKSGRATKSPTPRQEDG